MKDTNSSVLVGGGGGGGGDKLLSTGEMKKMKLLMYLSNTHTSNLDVVSVHPSLYANKAAICFFLSVDRQ